MMKNVFTKTIAGLLAVFLMMGFTAICFAEETADISWYDASAKSYTLKDEADLHGLLSLVEDRVNLYGKTFQLDNDITLTSSGSCTGNFNGILDGQGHTITVLSGSNGLFGSINGATVKNLTLDVTITGEAETVGALALTSTGCTVENVILKGKISGQKVTGGLLGTLTGKMKVNGFQTSAEIFGVEKIGGIVGNASFASSSGNLNVQNVEIGGKIFGAVLYAGGIVGYAYNTVTVSGAKLTAEMDAYNYVGGLVGMIGSVDETTGAATVSGVLKADHIQADINLNVPGGLGYAGGLAGSVVGDLHVFDSTVSATINGIGGGFGGIAGNVSCGSFQSERVLVSVVISAGRSIGGLCGISSGSVAVTDTAILGAVTATTTHAAGVIGANSANLDFSKVYVDVEIKAYKSAAGFVSESACTSAAITLSVADSVFAGTVTCENTGNVSAILGAVHNDANIALTRCFSVGKVGKGSENEMNLHVLLTANSTGTVTVADCYLISALSDSVGNGSKMPTLTEGSEYHVVSVSDMIGAKAAETMSKLDFTDTWVVTDSYPMPSLAVSLFGVEAKALPTAEDTNESETTGADTGSSGGCASVIVGGYTILVLTVGAVMLKKKKTV